MYFSTYNGSCRTYCCQYDCMDCTHAQHITYKHLPLLWHHLCLIMGYCAVLHLCKVLHLCTDVQRAAHACNTVHHTHRRCCVLCTRYPVGCAAGNTMSIMDLVAPIYIYRERERRGTPYITGYPVIYKEEERHSSSSRAAPLSVYLLYVRDI